MNTMNTANTNTAELLDHNNEFMRFFLPLKSALSIRCSMLKPLELQHKYMSRSEEAGNIR
jgi:hypothetical protein